MRFVHRNTAFMAVVAIVPVQLCLSLRMNGTLAPIAISASIAIMECRGEYML